MNRRRYHYRPAFTIGDALRVGLMVGTCLGCSVGVSWAGPEGGVIAGGSATIAQTGNSTTINQTSDRALIDWQSFNVGSNESVTFNQTSSGSIAINRIHDANPSTILGSLSANGQIMLINPNGVVFGNGSQVDVGSLVVSTASPTDENAQDFVAGHSDRLDLSVAGNPNAQILNAGTITAKQAGLVGFVAPNVINNGVIIANKGTVQLASGDMATLDLYGDGLVDVAVSPAVQNQLIEQNGWVQADGGKVVISAAAGETIVNSLINMGGVTHARSIEQKDGKIILTGDNSTINVTGTIDVSGKATGQHGGTLTATAKHINLKPTATIDASGDTGGGTIKIGGDYQGKGSLKTADTVTMEAGATIVNDAITAGDGGTTILWSDDHTYFAGSIFGRGGSLSGDGGFVETSGKANLTSTGSIDLSATSGNAGTWLIDPTNITIHNRSQGGTDNVNTFTTAYLEAQNAHINLLADNAITLNLSGDTLTLGNNYNLTLTATSGNIQASSTGTITTSGSGSITFTAGNIINLQQNLDLIANGSGSLTLRANGDITLANLADITTHGGDITFNADRDATGGGVNNIWGGSNIFSNGGNITLGGGANPLTDYAIATGNLSSGAVLTDTGFGTLSPTLNAGGGNITINGRGWNDAATTNSRGIAIKGASLITTGNGNITLNGIGGGTASTTSNNAHGVYLYTSSDGQTPLIQAVNGTISITGSSIEASTTPSAALNFTSGTVQTTGTGSINLTTTNNGSALGQLYGAGSILSGGNITYAGDKIDASGMTMTAAGDITLRPYTASTTVGIGTGTGTLQITNTALGKLTYGGTLWLGGYGLTGAEAGYWNSSGNLTLNTTRSFAKNVNFISGADILSGGASTITLTSAANTTLWTINDINISHDLDIIASGSGSVTERAGRNIIYSASGDITTTGGTITLNSDRDATNGGAISLGSGTNLTSNSGNITLGGGNAPETTAAIGNASVTQGIYLTGTNIDARGSLGIGGNISLYGQGYALGTGATSTDNNHGIYIYNSSIVQTNNSGTITATGVGGGTSTGRGSGISILSNSTVSSQHGNILLSGTGGTAAGSTFNTGIGLNGGNKIEATGNGNVTLIGTGGGTVGGTTNFGVQTDTSANILVNTGNLSITGIATYGTAFGGNGGSAATYGSISAGSVTFIANQISWQTMPNVLSGGDVIIRPHTAGTSVGIGSGTGTLSVTDAILNKITYGTNLWLGGYGNPGDAGYVSNAGNMTIGLTRSFSKNINFLSASNILTSTAGTITTTGTGNILFAALGDINLTTTQNFTASGTGSLTLRANGTIAHTGGGILTTQGGAITLNSDRDANNDGAITLSGLSNLISNGGNITLGGGADPTTTAAFGTSAYAQGIRLGNTTINAQGTVTGGNISLRGEGYLLGTDTNLGSSQHGIFINGGGAGAIVQTNQSGTLTFTGTARGTGNALGIYFIAGTHNVSAENGDINFTGTGLGSDGVAFGSGSNASLTSTGNGNITVTGDTNSTTYYSLNLGTPTGGIYSKNGQITLNAPKGIYSTSGASTTVLGGSNATGNINIITNKLMSNFIPNIQTTSDVIIRPHTAGTSVGIGSGAGTLNIANALLGTITYGGTLWLGGYGLTGAETGYWNSSGNLTLNTTRSFTKNVNFISGTDILSGGASTITLTGTASSTLWALNDINISHDLDITASGSGSISQRAGRHIIYSASGDITTSGGAITLNADRDATSGGAISLASGTVLTSGGGNITLGGGADPTTTAAIGTDATYVQGINLTNAVVDARASSSGGTIMMKGAGWTGSTANANATSAHGIFVNASMIQTNYGGSITMYGAGGGTGTAGTNSGVFLFGGSSVVGINGTMSITGIGGSGSSGNNNGVAQSGAVANIFQMNGAITISGTGIQNSPNSRGYVSGSTLSGIIGGAGDIILTLNSVSDNSIAAAGFIGGASATGSINLISNKSINLQGGLIQTTGAGSINLNAANQIRATANNTNILTANGNISFTATNGIDLDVRPTTITSTGGNINLNSALSTSVAQTFSAGGTLTANAISMGANDLTLTANDLVLNGNLTGTGTLTLQPNSNSSVACVNSGSGSCNFSLSTTEVGYLVDGWSSILIGRSSSTANMLVGASTWKDPTTFRTTGSSFIDGAITGTGNASFTFAPSIWVRGGSVNTAGGNIAFTNSLTFEGAGTFSTSGGSFTIGNQARMQANSLVAASISTAGGSININGGVVAVTVGAPIAGKVLSLDAGAGTIAFGNTVQGGTGSNAFDITATGGTLAFNGAWGSTTALRNVTLTSANTNFTLPNLTATGNVSLAAGTGSTITTGTIATGAGSLTLTADDVAIGGALSGTGSLTLQPYSNSRIVRLNTGISDFNLSSTELGYLVNGWSGIAIGRDTSTGLLLAGATTWSDPLTLRGNDNMQIQGDLTMTDGASLTFLNGYTNLYSNITTNGGSVTFSANTANAGGGQDAGTFFLQGNITTQGGDVSLKKVPVAGSSTIDTRNNGADGTITFNNGLNRSYKTSDSTLVLQAGTGSIVFNSTAEGTFGGGLLHLTAVANTISFNGAWGNSDPFGAVSLTAVNSLSLPSITASSVFARTTGGAADLTIGSGRAVTSSGAGGITLVAGRNVINQAGSGALVAGGSGRWLVYSTDVVGTTGEQDLANNFNRYSCSYGAGCAAGVSVPSSGHGLLYSYTPTLTVTPTTKTVVYGDAVSGLNGYAYSIAGYLGSDGSSDSITGSLNGATSYAAGNDVGTYALNYNSGSLASALGYSFSYANKANGVNVTARTVTASLTGTVTKIYDGNANAALAVGNYTLSNVYGSDAVSLGNITSGTYNDQNVGSGKAVSVSGLFLSGAKAGNYTLASSSISGNVGVVTPKGLTVSATTGQHKTYGQADSTFAYGYTGLVGGDTSASFTGALARAAGNNAGAYALNVGSLAATGNYIISSFVGADYTIDKAAINVTAPTGSRTYGNSNPTYSWADATISGLQYGESGAVLDNLSFTIANSATATANAGTTHAVTLGGFSDNNYTLGSFTGGMLTIAKAPLTITADSKTRVVIMPTPTLTASFSGLRNGDNASVVSGLTLSTSDYTGASVGSYAITAANGTAANYDITYVNGTMTVTPGALPTTIANPIIIVQTASGNPLTAPALANTTSNSPLQNDPAAALDNTNKQLPLIIWDNATESFSLDNDPLVTFSPELKQLLGMDI